MSYLMIMIISLLVYLLCLIFLLFIIGVVGCFAFIINEREIICCCCMNKLVEDFSENDEKNKEVILVINPDSSLNLGFEH